VPRMSMALSSLGGVPGLGAGEADRLELEAQLAASQALQRKTHARFEAVQQEQEQAELERRALRAEVGGLQQQLVATEGRERQQAHTAATATAQLLEARAEAKRLRLEIQERADEGGADDDDQLAMQQMRQDLQVKLDRSEQHREEVARKLGRARKHQQNQIQQYEAEISLLAEKSELMEDEIGDEIQARLELQTELEQARKKLEGLEAELGDVRGRQAKRAHILPEGVQELTDQLEMAHSVRQTLCADIAKLTEELVEAKLLSAQESDRAQRLEGKMCRGAEKQLAVALRMTELEVRLAEAQGTQGENEEAIAEAFKEVMKEQEQKIMTLEEELHQARRPASAPGGAPSAKTLPSRFGLR